MMFVTPISGFFYAVVTVEVSDRKSINFIAVEICDYISLKYVNVRVNSIKVGKENFMKFVTGSGM